MQLKKHRAAVFITFTWQKHEKEAAYQQEPKAQSRPLSQPFVAGNPAQTTTPETDRGTSSKHHPQPVAHRQTGTSSTESQRTDDEK